MRDYTPTRYRGQSARDQGDILKLVKWSSYRNQGGGSLETVEVLDRYG